MKTKVAKNKQVNFRIDEELYQKLETLRIEEDLEDVSSFVRRLIRKAYRDMFGSDTKETRQE